MIVKKQNTESTETIKLNDNHAHIKRENVKYRTSVYIRAPWLMY